jgi:hypothetical protein
VQIARRDALAVRHRRDAQLRVLERFRAPAIEPIQTARRSANVPYAMP